MNTQAATTNETSTMLSGAQILVRSLEHQGVDLIFGYPGGAIMPVYDALLESKIRHILTRHEQGAVFAADGYARSTGKVGVALATSGPGATNLVTGIADAYIDSIPLVAITGQVASPLMGTDAFQEVDIFGITLPIVKHSFIIRSTSDIPKVVAQAFEIARSGRPGPVLIDLPKDLTIATVPHPKFESPSTREFVSIDPTQLELARRYLSVARRPVLYVGGGVRNAKAANDLRYFAETSGIPAGATLHGLGGLPCTHPLALGMLGMHGGRAANEAVQEADLLLVVGARFDDRATGKLNGFAPYAKVIHIDADPAEIGKLRKADAALCGNISGALKALTGIAVPTNIEPWTSTCLARKKLHAQRYDAPFERVYAPQFLRKLSELAKDNTYIACDVGQHQMWVAQHYLFRKPEHHLTSGGLGAMGFGLPAAIGAQLANPEAKVICISGDGSIMMNIQELATLKRYNIPVTIVIFDNQALGMVRQWQEMFFSQRYSEVDLSDNPDFVKVALAFGLEAFRVDRAADVDSAIERILAPHGPLLVHVPIDTLENVWPIVPPGGTNSQMLEQPRRTTDGHM